MVSGVGSVHIDCEPTVVFDFVSDVENNPRWHPYVKATTLAANVGGATPGVP